jgi:hypothetical protein
MPREIFMVTSFRFENLAKALPKTLLRDRFPLIHMEMSRTSSLVRRVGSKAKARKSLSS